MDNNNFFWDNDPRRQDTGDAAPDAQTAHTAEPMDGQSEQPKTEQPKSEPVWHNESREAPQEEPTRSAMTQKQKKRRKSTVILAAIVAAVIVGVLGVIALDLVYVGVKDGALVISVGLNASEQANAGHAADPNVSVDDYLELEHAPEADVDMPAAGEELTIGQIAEICSPTVVGIVTQVAQGYQLGQSSGSGIIMSEDGYIVTNAHVIEDARSISVLLSDNTTHTAVVVGQDRDSDIAVIKIKASDLPVASFADSSTARVGDAVVAIGNPYGMELYGTVTNGIISAVNREITVDENTYTLLQTNAAINSGNSGGPLINRYGQVIGINSLKFSDAYADGLGFAIPTSVFKPIVDELITKGYIAGKPAIGIEGQIISEEYAFYLDIPAGFLISDFRCDAPVKAGLQKNDIITEFAGESFSSMAELNRIKDKYKAGDTVTLKIYRDDNLFDKEKGEYFTVELVLADEHELENEIG